MAFAANKYYLSRNINYTQFLMTEAACLGLSAEVTVEF
jgi:hypothetical protein